MSRTGRPSASARASRAASTARVWRATRRTTGILRQHPKVLNLPVQRRTRPRRPRQRHRRLHLAMTRRTCWPTAFGRHSSPSSPEAADRARKRRHGLRRITGVALGSRRVLPLRGQHRAGAPQRRDAISPSRAAPSATIRSSRPANSMGMAMAFTGAAPVPPLMTSGGRLHGNYWSSAAAGASTPSSASSRKARRCGTALLRARQRRHRAQTPSACPRSRPRISRAWWSWRRRKAWTLWSSRRTIRWRLGMVDALEAAGIPAFGPDEGRGRASRAARSLPRI